MSFSWQHTEKKDKTDYQLASTVGSPIDEIWLNSQYGTHKLVLGGKEIEALHKKLSLKVVPELLKGFPPVVDYDFNFKVLEIHLFFIKRDYPNELKSVLTSVYELLESCVPSFALIQLQIEADLKKLGYSGDEPQPTKKSSVSSEQIQIPSRYSFVGKTAKETTAPANTFEPRPNIFSSSLLDYEDHQELKTDEYAIGKIHFRKWKSLVTHHITKVQLVNPSPSNIRSIQDHVEVLEYREPNTNDLETKSKYFLEICFSTPEQAEEFHYRLQNDAQIIALQKNIIYRYVQCEISKKGCVINMDGFSGINRVINIISEDQALFPSQVLLEYSKVALNEDLDFNKKISQSTIKLGL